MDQPPCTADGIEANFMTTPAHCGMIASDSATASRRLWMLSKCMRKPSPPGHTIDFKCTCDARQYCGMTSVPKGLRDPRKIPSEWLLKIPPTHEFQELDRLIQGVMKKNLDLRMTDT